MLHQIHALRRLRLPVIVRVNICAQCTLHVLGQFPAPVRLRVKDLRAAIFRFCKKVLMHAEQHRIRHLIRLQHTVFEVGDFLFGNAAAPIRIERRVRLAEHHGLHARKLQQIAHPQRELQIQSTLEHSVRRTRAAVLAAVPRVDHHDRRGLRIGRSLLRQPRRGIKAHRQNQCKQTQRQHQCRLFFHSHHLTASYEAQNQYSIEFSR